MVSPRIDVHMLTFEEPQEWREQCLQSLEGAPITLHVLHGIQGHIGKARGQGFARGELPLVSFVDPDDLYEASAFAQLADALDSCPQALLAYTDEAVMDVQGNAQPERPHAYSRWQHANSASHVHGLIVMRRDAVMLEQPMLSAMQSCQIWMLTQRLAKRGAVLHLPIVGRYWRQHPNQAHRRMRVTDVELCRRLLATPI